MNKASAEAVTRLREYVPAPTADDLWKNVPFGRKAAVLIILYPNVNGGLSVVFTVRSQNLRSFPGQAAFPGGRADDAAEDPWDTALREASEEIAFDPARFKFEKLTTLPSYVSRNLLLVRPCVCLVQSRDGQPLTVRDVSGPMNGAEVQVVYSVELESFLSSTEPWYNGSVESVWIERPYVFHAFVAHRDQQHGLTEWLFEDAHSALAESYASNEITGLTAHIALDCARVAYGRDADGVAHLPAVGYDEPALNLLNSGGFMQRKI